MNKLSLTCECGQEMVVPASALGRSGLCPGCGTQVNITSENTHPYQPRRRPMPQRSVAVRTTEPPRESTSREDAWRNFAAAVDLYNTRRYAEALTLLNVLLRQFPGNEHVVSARDQCLEALQRVTHSGHTYDGQPIDDAVLSPELVKSVVLDKLLRASSEEVQLRAAELAARMLGILEPRPGGEQADFQETEPAPALLQEPGTSSGRANVKPGQNGHASKHQDQMSIRWRSETRRFFQPTGVSQAGPDASFAAPPSASHPPQPEAATTEQVEQAIPEDCDILLPEQWRLEREPSTRFPKKTTFE